MKFDPENPPAVLIFEADGKTRPSVTGYLLDAERRWTVKSKEVHARHPNLYPRPMCIVRLKALK